MFSDGVTSNYGCPSTFTDLLPPRLTPTQWSGKITPTMLSICLSTFKTFFDKSTFWPFKYNNNVLVFCKCSCRQSFLSSLNQCQCVHFSLLIYDLIAPYKLIDLHIIWLHLLFGYPCLDNKFAGDSVVTSESREPTGYTNGQGHRWNRSFIIC